MSKHITGCFDAAKATYNNRIAKLQTAYKEKDGRVVASFGVLKTAAAVLGYALYAGMPDGLRNYQTYDVLDEFSDGVAAPQDEAGEIR